MEIGGLPDKEEKKSAVSVELILDDPLKLTAYQSMTSIIWNRFRRHPAALISTAVLTLLILSVILVSFSEYRGIPLRPSGYHNTRRSRFTPEFSNTSVGVGGTVPIVA